MTDHSAAALANALPLEAKKHALRQQQDGCWILTMKVHQNDMPSEIMKAPMGARYVVAMVEVGDDEQPINRKDGDATVQDQHRPVATQPRPAQRPAGADKPKSPAQVAGYLCTVGAFQRFLGEKYPNEWIKVGGVGQLGGFVRIEDCAAAVVRELCKVDSRADLTDKNVEWNALRLAYQLWLNEPDLDVVA